MPITQCTARLALDNELERIVPTLEAVLVEKHIRNWALEPRPRTVGLFFYPGRANSLTTAVGGSDYVGYWFLELKRRATSGFFGQVKWKSDDYIFAVLWLANPDFSAGMQNWCIRVYGNDYMQIMTEIATALEDRFETSACIRVMQVAPTAINWQRDVYFHWGIPCPASSWPDDPIFPRPKSLY